MPAGTASGDYTLTAYVGASALAKAGLKLVAKATTPGGDAGTVLGSGLAETGADEVLMIALPLTLIMLAGGVGLTVFVRRPRMD